MAETPDGKASIFVSIASYRDPECYWTIRDLYAKAAEPDRVFVGVCLQFQWPDDAAHFPGVIRPEQTRFVGVDARSSKGCSWAKHRAQQLWRGEDYHLAIDSHMRFHEGWDRELIAMLGRCDAPKPVLSSYPACYEPPDDLHECCTAAIVPERFDESGDGSLLLHSVNRHTDAPSPAALIAGGFAFSSSRLIEEVPFDPLLYFVGLELSLSVRAFTRGWDIFCPDRCTVHHYYQQTGGQKHWDDHAGWHALERRSVARMRHLLGLEASRDPRVTEGLDGLYGLGSERSLAAYEALTGIDFRARTIAERGKRGEYAAAHRRAANSA